MKRKILFFCIIPLIVSMSGCRNNAVSSQSGPDAAAESAAKTEETEETTDTDTAFNYPKEFDDSHYTDLTEIENKYKEYKTECIQEDLSIGVYCNQVDDLSNQYLKIAQADYDKIQGILDYIFSFKYTDMDSQHYFNVNDEKRAVDAYWTSELDRAEKEKSFQQSLAEMEYPGGSVAEISIANNDFKLYHDLAYKMRDFETRYENIIVLYTPLNSDSNSGSNVSDIN